MQNTDDYPDLGDHTWFESGTVRDSLITETKVVVSNHFVPTTLQQAFIEKWGHMDPLVHGEFTRDLIGAFG